MESENKCLSNKARVLPGSWNAAYDNDIGNVCSCDDKGNAVLEFSNGNRMSFCKGEFEFIQDEIIKTDL